MEKIQYFLVFMVAVAIFSAEEINCDGKNNYSIQQATNTSSVCGGVLYGNQGLIEYRVNQTYERYESCIWTIRTPFQTQIRIQIIEFGLTSLNDIISIQTLNSTGLAERHYFYVASPIRTILMNGTVAFVSFGSITRQPEPGTGFSLTFVAEGPIDDTYKDYVDYFANITETPAGSLKYPVEGSYANMEFSTFVFARPSDQPNSRLNLTFTSLNIDKDSVGNCTDKLYLISSPGNSIALLPYYTLCDLPADDLSDLIRTYKIVVLLLITDDGGTSGGFELEWSLT